MKKTFIGLIALMIIGLLIFTACQPSNTGPSPTKAGEETVKPGQDENGSVNTTKEPSEPTDKVGEEEGFIVDKVKGVDGVEFNIKRPGQDLELVDATSFGMSTDNKDNTQALLVAIAYCKSKPGSRLDIPKGTYYFDSAQPLMIKDVKNLLIEGNGSEFIFRDMSFITISACQQLELRNIIIDWDWEVKRLASIIKAVKLDREGRTIDFEFTELDSVDPNVPWLTMNQLDPETLTPGCEDGVEFWENQLNFEGVEKVADNVLRVYHNGSLNRVKEEDIFLLRHHTYGSNAVRITKESHDITLDGIIVYSVPGMAFLVDSGSHHYQLKNCTVGLRPGSNRRISATADAFHAADTGGYAYFDRLDFSFMGDDCINIHDNVSVVEERLSNGTIKARWNMTCEVGDTIGFMGKDLKNIVSTRKITKKQVQGSTYILEFDEDLDQEIGPGSLLYNTRYDSSNYVIRNSYFHENRARGLLLQTDNGLVENNRFYRTQGAAILVILDITKSQWTEGTGVDNLLIQNNEFDRCNVNNWTGMIELKAQYYERPVDAQVFTNITIKDNLMKDFPSWVLYICSADGVRFTGNRIVNNLKLKENLLRGGIDIEKSRNIEIDNNTWVESPYVKTPGEITVLDPDLKDEVNIHNNQVVKNED